MKHLYFKVLVCLLCFGLFVGSCSFAYTWNDYKEFLDSLEPNTNVGGMYNFNVQNWRNYREQLISYVENNYSPENYNSFAFGTGGSGSRITFFFILYDISSNSVYSTNSSSSIKITNSSCVAFCCYNETVDNIAPFTPYGYVTYSGTIDSYYIAPRKIGTNNIVTSSLIGPDGIWLLENADNTFLQNPYPMQNMWNKINVNNFEIATIVNNFRIATGSIGLYYRSHTLNFFLRKGNEIVQELQPYYYGQYNSEFYLECDLTDSDITNGTYDIYIEDLYYNPDVIISTSPQFTLTFITNGGNNNGTIVIGGNSNITNPSGEVIGSIDNSNIIGAITSFNSGDLVNSLNSITSGDILDRVAFDSTSESQFQFYYDYINHFYNSIITLLTSSGNVTLPIQYRDFSFTLNSSDFFVPNSWFKTFMSAFLIFGFVYLIYWDLYKQYKHIREFDVFRTLHDTDIDYNLFL